MFKIETQFMVALNWQEAFGTGLCFCTKLFLPQGSKQSSSLGLEITRMSEIFR